MRTPDEGIKRIERAFWHARSQLGLIGSTRDEVERRIAATSIKKTSRLSRMCAIATLALLASATLLWWRAGNMSPRPRGPVAGPTPDSAQEPRMDVGDIDLTEHLAAIIDHRIVVVIWSYRGKGVVATRTSGAGRSAGKYQLASIHEGKLANGRTIACSLLVPEPGVRPILEPPSICVTSGDSDLIALSVSPRPASTAELAGAIQSAEGNENAGISVEDILREIRRHTLAKVKEANTPQKDPL